MDSLASLIDLLKLIKTSDDIYEGKSYETAWGRVFGGQVLGQSLSAAYATVPQDRTAHSMHGYFILAGKSDQSIRYEVDRIRDGGSLTTRRVVAWQGDDAIYSMSASFQKSQEGYEHQISIPNVLPPEVLLTDYDQIKHLKEINPKLYRRLTIIHPNAIEFRPVENFYSGESVQRAPFRHVWFRARGEVQHDIRLQHQLLAYASDYNLLTTAAVPHLDQALREDVFFASIDHALWFHSEPRMDEWMLYATDSPFAGGSRGYSRGGVFDYRGQLIASVAQEGLIRKMR